MMVNGRHYRTIWMKGSSVFMIDQNLLPFDFRICVARTHLETCKAIKNMTVRGAGAIGAAAGFGMAQGFIEATDNNFWSYAEEVRRAIESTRPTAQNLFYATNRVFNAAKISEKPREAATTEAQKIADEDAENCRMIGKSGNELIEDGCTMETHCNAGWLAFVDWGSALSPVYFAHREGKNITVYADETRPRGQGARLTAWELRNEGVPHFIIPDNAGAHLMSRGEVDLMIVGADRIAKNGDVANKIGTLEKAIVANEYGVPFYIAAPMSTFDLGCKSGRDIPIEHRSEMEVLWQSGITKDRKSEKILVCSPESGAINPAFDVTPAKYIKGIITERGIISPNENSIKELFS